jgi:gamma-glutamylcyclotransferase (GGCT)/AIG2-like uncharacterized protein YtfP
VADYLFAYGTLKPGVYPPELARVVGGLNAVGSGIVRGTLYDLGKYPGLQLDDGGNEICGEILEFSDPAVLVFLDAYEGYDPRNPALSLFIRKRCQVRQQNIKAELLCWIYEYNHPPGSSQKILVWSSKPNSDNP